MKQGIAVLVVTFVLCPVLRAQPVYFADPDLKAAVERELGVTNPTVADMLGLSRLSLWGGNIDDLTGLEYATNLISLRLRSQEISDVSPLAGLTNLISLYLDENQISDVSPLAGLTNLEELWLDSNQISDVSPLAGLTNLERLGLYFNQISDLSPLAGLTNVVNLFLNGNPLCQEACDVYIPLLESYGTFVFHDDCVNCAAIPDVVGMSQSEAESALADAGFVADIWWGPSDTVPEGYVIRQDPSAGTMADPNTAVRVTISQGFGDGPGPGPGPVTPLPATLAHWKLDEASGAVAHDETGNHHGTVSGNPIWEPAGGQIDGPFSSTASMTTWTVAPSIRRRQQAS